MYWDHSDPRLVRSMVYVSFPQNILVPRDVVYREFANWGGIVVSWTAAVYILHGRFADAIVEAVEDDMPGDGNPHPLPGQPDPPALMWGLPPYPALGWNGVQPPQPADDHHQENIQGDDNADGGWVPWGEPVAQLDEVMQQDIAGPAQE